MTGTTVPFSSSPAPVLPSVAYSNEYFVISFSGLTCASNIASSKLTGAFSLATSGANDNVCKRHRGNLKRRFCQTTRQAIRDDTKPIFPIRFKTLHRHLLFFPLSTQRQLRRSRIKGPRRTFRIRDRRQLILKLEAPPFARPPRVQHPMQRRRRRSIPGSRLLSGVGGATASAGAAVKARDARTTRGRPAEPSAHQSLRRQTGPEASRTGPSSTCCVWSRHGLWNSLGCLSCEGDFRKLLKGAHAHHAACLWWSRMPRSNSSPAGVRRHSFGAPCAWPRPVFCTRPWRSSAIGALRPGPDRLSRRGEPRRDSKCPAPSRSPPGPARCDG